MEARKLEGKFGGCVFAFRPSSIIAFQPNICEVTMPSYPDGFREFFFGLKPSAPPRALAFQDGFGTNVTAQSKLFLKAGSRMLTLPWNGAGRARGWPAWIRWM